MHGFVKRRLIDYIYRIVCDFSFGLMLREEFPAVLHRLILLKDWAVAGHAFKNHPFEVRDDEEMRAMVSLSLIHS